MRHSTALALALAGMGLTAKIGGLSITPLQRDFFRVLNALQTAVDCDEYVRRAGFEICDTAE
jgi:hypothetical protein